MKRVLVLGLMMVATVARAGWDADVVHVYELDNDLTDSVGSIDGSAVGGLTYDSVVKRYGSHSANGFADGVYFVLPDTLINELGTYATWSIGMWVKMTPKASGYQIASLLYVGPGLPNIYSAEVNRSSDWAAWQYRNYGLGVLGAPTFPDDTAWH